MSRTQRAFIAHSPECLTSKIKVKADRVSGGKPLLGSQAAFFLLSPRVVDGGRELSGVLFIGALISFMTAPPSRSTHLPKPYPLTLSPWELGSQYINFAGTQTFRREQVDTNGDSTLNISESCQLLPTVALPLAFLPAMNCCCCCCSISKLFPPHGLQHARLPCPSQSPRVCSSSCSLSW